MLAALAVLVVSCAAPGTQVTDIPSQPTLPDVKIERHPEPADLSGNYLELTSIPKFDPNVAGVWQVDLRSRDLTKIDMKASFSNLIYAIFDSKTQWPTSDKMPVGFDWQKIMGLGKDPGLGVRALHEQGITGAGIGIAIIDQPLLIDHQEYKDRLRLYEEINIPPETEAQMHGGAVASIAVGKTIGVAPEADLYYIGALTSDWDPNTNDFTRDFNYHAQAVHRILEINRGLPEDYKIRVIAMQVGWSPDQAGYDEITAAVNEAKEAVIFVISSSLGSTHGLYFQGLGRYPLDDPNEFESYVPGLWWEKDFFSEMPLNTYLWSAPDHMLLIPMDSRATASPTGTKDYVFYRQGGWSWSIPYLAGMYALSVQVKPEISPEEFWETALSTGKTIKIQHSGQYYAFGIILDPQSLIAAIKSK
jgi:hypothetical protein